MRIHYIKLENSRDLFGGDDWSRLIKVQACVRRFIARMRYKKIMFGIICIYYVRRTTSVVRITVRKVELKRTVTEKHTKTERHGNEAEKVSQETRTKEIEFMEGY